MLSSLRSRLTRSISLRILWIIALSATLGDAAALAQAGGAYFVTFNLNTAPSTGVNATTYTMPPPATGPHTSYSAACLTNTGTTWNNMFFVNPTVLSAGGTGNPASGSAATTSATAYPLYASPKPLVDSAGAAGAVGFNLKTVYGNTSVQGIFGVSQPGTAPNTANPPALMGRAWRNLSSTNTFVLQITGLPPNTAYELYSYGSGATASTTGQAVALSAANQLAGHTSTGVSGGSAPPVTIYDASGNLLPPGPASASAAITNVWVVVSGQSDASGAFTWTVVRPPAPNSGIYMNGFQLAPYPKPLIQTQPPASYAAPLGSDFTMSVVASGVGTLNYQWQKSTDNGANFIPITGNATAATASLTLANVSGADAAIYNVVVTNSYGTATSASAVLTISGAPAITSQPVSRTVLSGASATFAVVATGAGTLSYQWSKNGTPIGGATSSSYTISAAAAGDSGNYTVHISNGAGSVTSSAAALVVVGVLPIPAFPGAEGPGATASGGRGGDVFHVTTLDDDRVTPPAGSLRQALTTAPPGGRTVVFDVGGTIQLRSSQAGDAGSLIWLRSGANNITIAGQTAPHPGITIIGQGTKLTGNNMVVRNLAFRPGPDKKSPGNSTNDGLSLQTTNSIVDHVSAGYADDEGLSATDAAANTTVQYSIIAEGLNYVLTDGTAHAMGSLLASEVADAPLSLHHNLYSDMRTRNPRIGNDGNGVVLGGANEGSLNNVSNNLIYNWSGRACYDVGGKPARANFLNNFFVAGPNTLSTDPVFFGTGTNTRVYSAGNVVDMNNSSALNGRAFSFTSADTQFSGSIATAPTPFAVDPGYLQSAASAYDSVLNHAGTFWWNRTALEARIVHEVRTKAGKVIKSGLEVSSLVGYEYPATTNGPVYQEPAVAGGGEQVRIFDGLPLFPLVTRPAGFDTDGDGMANSWELDHGLNPNVADHNGDFDGDGYSNLEEYLNDLAAFPAPKTLAFAAGGGRYELATNWALNWQPSRYDSVLISSGTTTVDSVGQHARAVTIAGQSLPAELRLNAGWLQVQETVTVGGASGKGTLRLAGGALLAGSGVIVADGGTLSGSGTITGPLTVQAGGVVDVGSGTFAVTGNLTNHGTVRLTGGAASAVSGAFVNNGVLDIMTGAQTLPANLVNNGIVLDSRDIRVETMDKTGATFTLTVQGYAGHSYQLERADTLGGTWAPVGAARAGANSILTFTDTNATGTQMFYQVKVAP